MRTFFLAMSEVEHDKRSWRCPGMVMASIVLTLALNATLREQAALLHEASSSEYQEILPLVFTALATLAQLVAAGCLLMAETPRGDLPSREPLVVIAISHACSVFLQAYLAGLGNMHGSLAIAFVEPVVALLVLWVVTSLPGRPYAWIGMLSVSLGLTFLTMSLGTVFQSERTSLIQGLSSFALILKNIVIRHLTHYEKVTVTARDSSYVTGFVVTCGCVIAGVYTITSPIWIGPTFCALTSTLLSTALLFVTIRVLKSYNVVFASLFHIFALFLEAQAMMPAEKRPDLIVVFAAVVILLIGLFLFLKDWVDTQTAASGIPPFSRKAVNTNEQYTRIEFLLFSSMVIGVIFYVFQPRLSQRDLQTLSYVGLDKVFRKLLSIKSS